MVPSSSGRHSILLMECHIIILLCEQGLTGMSSVILLKSFTGNFVRYFSRHLLCLLRMGQLLLYSITLSSTRGSSVSILTTLSAREPANQGLIPGRYRYFAPCHSDQLLRPNQSLIQLVLAGLFAQVKIGHGVMLIIHLHPVTGLRIKYLKSPIYLHPYLLKHSSTDVYNQNEDNAHLCYFLHSIFSTPFCCPS
jgi:hypothetical protein